MVITWLIVFKCKAPLGCAKPVLDINDIMETNIGSNPNLIIHL